jgi:hypothetical protein
MKYEIDSQIHRHGLRLEEVIPRRRVCGLMNGTFLHSVTHVIPGAKTTGPIAKIVFFLLQSNFRQ